MIDCIPSHEGVEGEVEAAPGCEGVLGHQHRAVSAHKCAPKPSWFIEKQDAVVKLIAWFHSHSREQLALTNALPNPAGNMRNRARWLN
jgi:hypothetical protein